jgi:hypothetical protein
VCSSDLDNSDQKTFADTNSLLEFLPDALSDAWTGKKNSSRAFGRALSKMNGRVFSNDLQLKKGEISHHAVTWRIKKVVKTTNPGS